MKPVALRRRLKAFRQQEPLHRLVGVFGFLADGAFLTKRGEVGLVLSASLRDGECLDPEQWDASARRFETALRNLDERTRLYQYLIKSGPVRDPAPKRHRNPVVTRAQAARHEHLGRQAGLFGVECFFVIVRGSSGGLESRLSRLARWLSGGLSSESSASSVSAGIDKLAGDLASQADRFAAALSDVLPTKRLDRPAAYGFLRRLLNPDERHPAPAPSSSLLLDYHLCGSALECRRDHLRLGGSHLNLLTLKEFPPRTSAHLLRSLLSLPASILCVSEWRCEPNEAMRRRIRAMRRHFFNSRHSLASYLGKSAAKETDRLTDESAAAHADSLGRCLTELDVNGRRFGRYSLTLALLADDPVGLKRACGQAAKAVSDLGGMMIPERINQLNAFLGILPGNSHYNLRRQYVMDANAADLFLLFGLDSGSARNDHLGAPHLVTLATPHGVPYRLNLHEGDLAHSLLVGSTGSGKSFLLNFLLTHLQQYSPQTLILDLGQGYKSVTGLFGGSYLAFGQERQVPVNPFALPATETQMEFLHAFCSLLLESEGEPLGGEDKRDLFRQIESLYGVPRHRRTLSTLAAILRPPLRRRLKRWVRGGQYGRYFDNAADELSLAEMQCLDFQGLEQSPVLLQALLFYVLHRAGERIRDPKQSTRLKVLCVDEAWRFLKDASAGAWLAEALKTWRKHNAAVLLATQSSSDLGASDLLQAVLESCANKIFLANPGMDRALYRRLFNLNRTEAGRITDLLPRRQLLLKRRDHAKVLELSVGPEDYWLYTSDPFERARRRRAVRRHGLHEALQMLASQRPESAHTSALPQEETPL